MKTIVIHGIKISDESPLVKWPGAALAGVTRCNVKYWGGTLLDWSDWYDLHPLHSDGEWQGIRERRPEAWAWYQQQTAVRPIWMQDTHRSIRGSRVFPRAEIQRAFPILESLGEGPVENRMFTCMVDWIIAHACYRGYERIVLNGIGVNSTVEHQFLHRGILYWMGFVRGRGGEFLVDEPSTFRQPTKVYGYEGFGYSELRSMRRALNNAQRRARGLPPLREVHRNPEVARGR